MPKYQCPECEAVLKREEEVEPGKKIRCPKCETVFKPKPMRRSEEEPENDASEKKKKKKTKEVVPAQKKEVVPAQKKNDDDDEEGGSYGLIKEDEPEDDDPKKKAVHYGSLRDKFAKSKRGPAMAMLVAPSNIIMGEGLLISIGSLIGFLVILWPLAFSSEPHTSGQVLGLILLASLAVFVFAVGGFICYAASCMHELRRYSLVWAGCVVAVFPVLGSFTCFIIFGVVAQEIWGILFLLPAFFGMGIFKAFKALPTELVKGGFVETLEKAVELKV